MSATAGDAEFRLPGACTSLSFSLSLSLSLSPAVLSSLRSPFSPGIFCILPVLCNASLQLRQAGSSVFLLHRSAAGLLRECVCGDGGGGGGSGGGRKERRQQEREREREYVLPVCMCAHVCVSVLQSSVAMATSGTWLRQLRRPSAARVVLQEASFLSVVEKCIQTPFSM